MEKSILELETRLGLNAGFFEGLKSEDDWSFVITLHALFEAACTHLLLFHFQEPELADFFSRIDVSAKPIGKLAILGRLKLLGDEERRFISSLSELRNNLVHDVRNHRYSLESMIAGFDQEKLRKFAVSFSPFETKIRSMSDVPLFKEGIGDSLAKQAAVDALINRARTDPKGHIWFGSHSVLVTIVEMYGYSDYQQWIKARKLFEDGDE